jgi:hypothetical protein
VLYECQFCRWESRLKLVRDNYCVETFLSHYVEVVDSEGQFTLPTKIAYKASSGGLVDSTVICDYVFKCSIGHT